MSDKEFSVNFADGMRYNLDDIRQREESFMPDGEHAWIISAIYALDDPETSMDSMALTGENFVGVTQISCLICHVRYETAIRHHKCPQTVAAS